MAASDNKVQVPPHIFERVFKDNERFITESRVLSLDFYHFVLDLGTLFCENYNKLDAITASSITQWISHFFMNVLCHSILSVSESELIPKIGSVLSELLKKDIMVSRGFLENIMADPSCLLDPLLESKQPQVRKQIADVLITALNYVIDVEYKGASSGVDSVSNSIGDKSLSVSNVFIERYITLYMHEARKHGLRHHEYYRVIENLTMSSCPPVIMLLHELHTISHLHTSITGGVSY